MSLYWLVDKYVNPFTCHVNLLQEKVLENRWVCCYFWYAHDLFTTIIEQECGQDSVDNLESFEEMMIPLIRERCPGNRDTFFDCKMMFTIIIVLACFWFSLGLFSLVGLICWCRGDPIVRRKNKLAENKLYQTDNVKIEFELEKLNANK